VSWSIGVIDSCGDIEAFLIRVIIVCIFGFCSAVSIINLGIFSEGPTVKLGTRAAEVTVASSIASLSVAVAVAISLTIALTVAGGFMVALGSLSFSFVLVFDVVVARDEINI